MMLADTSIWIDHFRNSDQELRAVIENDALLCHPAVIGELTLGSLRDRQAVLSFLDAQREVAVASHDEVMGMIDRHSVVQHGDRIYRRPPAGFHPHRQPGVALDTRQAVAGGG